MSNTEIIDGISCRKLSEEDLPQVKDFIDLYYSPRGILEEIFKADYQCSLLYHASRSRDAIGDHVSFGLFNKNGKMIRLNMAKIYEKGKSYKKPSVEGDECPGHQAKLRFLQYLEGDLYSDLGANRVMDLCLSTGDPEYHGKRLWKKFKIYELLEASAREKSCDYIVSSPINVYSQKILKEAGFSLVREIKYPEYVDPLTGQKPDLELSEIHTSALFMSKKVL